MYPTHGRRDRAVTNSGPSGSAPYAWQVMDPARSGGAEPRTVYLDHAATTPMVPAAVEVMTAHLLEVGNPSSLHALSLIHI